MSQLEAGPLMVSRRSRGAAPWATLVAGLLVALMLLAGAHGAYAGPVEPDRAIRAAQQRILRNRDDAGAYLRLGDAYVQKARASGDIGYYARAEEALRRAVELAPTGAGAWRHLAYVSSARHEFQEAAAHARKAIQLDPEDADAYGVLGDAALELGQYDEAETAYRTMLRIAGTLGAYARLSGLKSLRGDVAGAIDDLKLAIRLGQANGEPKESVAWAQWQLGSEYFAVGNLASAEAEYSASLVTLPGYYRGLAGTAQIRAAQGRLDAAVELYRKALAAVPFPEYAAALGDIYRALGRNDDAKKHYDLVEYIGELNTINKVLYNRERAYFYADHDVKVDRALELAEKELEIRKDIYGFDILAWTLYKTGKLGEARAAITEALRLGTKDARLFFHAGMIHRGLGDDEQARQYLRLALTTNPYFHISQAVTAERTLRDLGGRPEGPQRATP